MRRSPRRIIMVVASAGLLLGCSSPAVSTAAPSAGSSQPSTANSAARVSVADPAPIPPVSAAARAIGLIDVRTVVPDALIDLRYATSNNFVGVRLYPRDARCLVHTSMSAGLRTAAARLRSDGYRLVFWDCYRPHSVQQRMFDTVSNPAWVAAPGPYSRSHEAGRSVDVTLARRGPCTSTSTPRKCLVDMGTDFDSFTPAAHAHATTGVSATAQRNRAQLRTAMTSGGLSIYSGEWWHFDGPGAGVQRPIIDVAPR